VRGSAAERSSAARAVERGTLVIVFERIVVVASAGALALERVVAADDAERVLFIVMPEASAYRAPFDDHRLRGRIATQSIRHSRQSCNRISPMRPDASDQKTLGVLHTSHGLSG